jgi:putative glycosyltransferase (TIGR04348 family)
MIRIFIVTPAGRGSRSGNRNTAVRWSALLRECGYRVDVDTQWRNKATDLLIVLHARRSYESLARYREIRGDAPLILALTGTDLYRDIRHDENAQRSMQLADRMIVLQPHGLNELNAELRAKTHVVFQSAMPITRARPIARHFEVVVIGHLREEKDPFRGALAAAFLPPESRVRIVHMGQAMNPEFSAQANRLMHDEPRYGWIGEIPHWKVRRYLARAQALLLSSRMEGGANVASEAIAAELPIIASYVSGNIGMLGEDYAGYYPVENERALAAVLWRFETEVTFREMLAAQIKARKPLVTEEGERHALQALVKALTE